MKRNKTTYTVRSDLEVFAVVGVNKQHPDSAYAPAIKEFPLTEAGMIESQAMADRLNQQEH